MIDRRAALIAGLSFTGFGVSPRISAAQMSNQDRVDLSRIEAYLNSVRSLKAHFVQTAPDGQVSEGIALMQRPGKMRIVYDDPVPVLIVCTNDTVYYWDKKLDQLSQIGIKDTPAWFLLRPEIKLTGVRKTYLKLQVIHGVDVTIASLRWQLRVARAGRSRQPL